jgi:cytoskeletal protein CcmA (bactofilin family)
MFNRKTDRLKLVLGESSKITGDIETLGTMIVDGTIIGHVSGEKVIIGEKAYIKGNIDAKNIILGGKIDGDLKGKERVELRATGKVSGDIFTSRLSITEGAVFHGMSHMIPVDGIEQEEKKPSEQPDGSRVVELFVKEKTG